MKKRTENEESINIDNEEAEMHNTDASDDVILEEEAISDTVKKLREKLRTCEREKHEYLDGWQRSKADSINTRKRDDSNRVASLQRVKEDIIQSIIPVLDSFELAFSHSKNSVTIDSNWISGMKNIQAQLLGILKEHGITEVNPIGETFDPNVHDSIEMVETTTEDENGKIVKVHQRGYMLDEKIIRAAKVSVAHLNTSIL